MFGSAILDIAIGTVFLFLLLSLIASTINELILSLVNLRGRNLARGLREMLEDPRGAGLVQKIYAHGLINGFFRGDYNPQKGGNLPSYIPSRTFALALMDVILPGTAAAVATKPLAPTTAVAESPGASPAVPAAPLGPENGLLTPFRNAVKELGVGKVQQSLIALIDVADHDAAKLRQGIEEWYNTTMDRVSGWYKYRTQWILFWIGIVLAISLNADTLLYVRHLSNDAALRQSLVAEAQEQVKQSGGNPGSITEQTNRIESLGLPIGWSICPANSGNCKNDPDRRNFPGLFGAASWEVCRFHFFGWLISGVAISLGAPFWFDILNKFMVVRSTVKPREKSHEEHSKDAS